MDGEPDLYRGDLLERNCCGIARAAKRLRNLTPGLPRAFLPRAFLRRARAERRWLDRRRHTDQASAVAIFVNYCRIARKKVRGLQP